MKSIGVYEVEAQKIEELCNEWSTTEAEIIEALFQVVEDEDIDLGKWL